VPGAWLNLSAIVPFPEGGFAFLSASGGLGYALAREAARRPGVGFSRFVSFGNQADLALDDYVRADPHTRSVLVFAEGFVRGRGCAFLKSIERTAADKPVLILRGGRTGAGRRTEMANRVADRVVQIFGGRGYCRDFAAERHFRHLRVDRIWEGTSEIMREIIVNGVMKRDLDRLVR
jgi:succinyl-CoA synthetase alpha subunit